MLGSVAAYTRPDQVVLVENYASAFARVVWAGDSAIPLPEPVIAQVRDTAEQIAASLDFYRLGYEPSTFSWSIAQATVASHKLKPFETKRIANFFRAEADPSCGCWREIPGHTHPRHVAASGWIIFALAEISEPATSAEISFFTGEQQIGSEGGWWSVFPVESEDSQHASTYATAWAVLALHKQRSTKGLSTGDDLAARLAIDKGAGWLINRREPRARWKDYPKSTSGKTSESISGFVVHVLHQVWPHNLREIDRAWLDNLPTPPPAVGDADHGYRWITGKDGNHLESIVQIRLPWMLIATVDAYPSGGIWQRVRALLWMEQALQQESITAETQERNWWRAELLYALRYVLEASSKSKKRNGAKV